MILPTKYNTDSEFRVISSDMRDVEKCSSGASAIDALPEMSTVARMRNPSSQSGGLSLYGSAVEYGLHSILCLIKPRAKPVSSRDLAEFVGISSALVAKIMPKLEKAGLVSATGGIAGGYRLALPAEEITVLMVVDAIDGGKSLFDCKQIRGNCALFGGQPPAWSTHGVCGIHAVMLRAQKSMRAELGKTSILSLAMGVRSTEAFAGQADQWFDDRAAGREVARIAAVRKGRHPPTE